jgi:hypothetical protein
MAIRRPPKRSIAQPLIGIITAMIRVTRGTKATRLIGQPVSAFIGAIDRPGLAVRALRAAPLAY